MADPRIAGTRESELDDERIQSKVETRLRLDDRIAWGNLEVAVDHGMVTLHGVVRTQEERGWAVKAAGTVSGVRQIANRILVQSDLPAKTDRQDAHVENRTRDRVIEGQEQLKDKQIMP